MNDYQIIENTLEAGEISNVKFRFVQIELIKEAIKLAREDERQKVAQEIIDWNDNQIINGNIWKWNGGDYNYQIGEFIKQKYLNCQQSKTSQAVSLGDDLGRVASVASDDKTADTLNKEKSK